MKEQETMVLSAASGGVRINVQRLGPGGNTAIFHCAGYIDTYNSPDFTAAVRGMTQQGVKNLIFNLAKITYISSTGIGCFTTALKEVKPKGGDILLVSPTPKVQELFQLLGFSTFFNVTDSIEDALLFFSEHGTPATIPFEKMQTITATFGQLERFVEKDKQQEFYAEILEVLKQIQNLQRS